MSKGREAAWGVTSPRWGEVATLSVAGEGELAVLALKAENGSGALAASSG